MLDLYESVEFKEVDYDNLTEKIQAIYETIPEKITSFVENCERDNK
jgi:hypothetical protein